MSEPSPSKIARPIPLREKLAGQYVLCITSDCEGGKPPFLLPVENFTEEQLQFIRAHPSVCNEFAMLAYEERLYEEIGAVTYAPNADAFSNDSLQDKRIALLYYDFVVL